MSPDNVTMVREDRIQAPPHLLLGITYRGMINFLTRIGFPFAWHSPMLNHGMIVVRFDGLQWLDRQGNPLSGDSELVKELAKTREQYPLDRAYTRDASLAWVTEMCGDKLVGYDLGSTIKCWLSDNGHNGKSVCELLLEEGSSHVGQAEAFLSHCQSEPISTCLLTIGRIALFNTTMHGKVKKALKREPTVWVDYFVLRQCKNDFVPEQIVSVIGAIGLTVIELDVHNRYLKRSFCILESYATVKEHSELVCLPAGVTREARFPCDGQLYPEIHVQSKNAQTWQAKDKGLIDAYILNNVGFEKLDSIIKHEITHGWRLMTFGIWVPLCPRTAADYCPRAALCGYATMSWLTCGISFDICSRCKHRIFFGSVHVIGQLICLALKGVCPTLNVWGPGGASVKRHSPPPKASKQHSKSPPQV